MLAPAILFMAIFGGVMGIHRRTPVSVIISLLVLALIVSFVAMFYSTFDLKIVQ